MDKINVRYLEGNKRSCGILIYRKKNKLDKGDWIVMLKKELESLQVGQKVQSKKDNSISTVTGIADKVELDNNKQYSQSTMIRWYSIYEEDNTDTEEFDVESFNSEQQQEQDTTTDTEHTTEGNTTTPGQQIFENSISGVVIQHGCHLNRMKEYVKVGKEGYKGCLVYIRTARDKSWKFDVSKKTWNKLTSEYQQYLIEQYGASIVDSSRGLWRIANCNELDVFEVLLLTALKIA